MIPVFVINLERSTHRRARITENLNQLGIPFRFVNAIDGGLHCTEQTIFSWYCNAYLMPGEVGCLLSHSNAALAAAEHEFACVLEDDAVLSERCLPLLQRDALASLPRFDILRLAAYWRGRHLPIGRIGDVPICAPFRSELGSFAQIYSRAGARRVSNDLARWTEPVDLYLYYDKPAGLRVLDVGETIAAVEDEGRSVIKEINGKFSQLAQSRYRRLRHRTRRLVQFLTAWGPAGLYATTSKRPSRS